MEYQRFKKITWAERSDTIREVGSIYTVQGFDLNHVGVVLGPSIDYDPLTGQLVVDIEKYKDTVHLQAETIWICSRK